MSPSTPTAKIHNWRTHVWGAWLIKIDHTTVTSLEEAHAAFEVLRELDATSTVLLFAHPEIRLNLFHNGLPIISSAPFTQATHDQLNNRWEFSTVADYLCDSSPSHTIVDSGDVLNIVNRVMRLT